MTQTGPRLKVAVTGAVPIGSSPPEFSAPNRVGIRKVGEGGQGFRGGVELRAPNIMKRDTELNILEKDGMVPDRVGKRSLLRMPDETVATD